MHAVSKLKLIMKRDKLENTSVDKQLTLTENIGGYHYHYVHSTMEISCFYNLTRLCAVSRDTLDK